jgi:hypothetical protein
VAEKKKVTRMEVNRMVRVVLGFEVIATSVGIDQKQNADGNIGRKLTHIPYLDIGRSVYADALL